MDHRALGRFFENRDTLFALFNGVGNCLATCNALNRAGVTAALMDDVGDLSALAELSGIPADKLERLLDFLTGHEIVAKTAPGQYRATDRTAVLLDGAPLLENCETPAMAGTRLLDGLRSDGATPFELFFGQPVFEYFADNPQYAQNFAAFMGWMTQRFERFLFEQHRFEPFDVVADIGGSTGDLLLAILERYPGTKGILFDRPETIAIAAQKVGASPLAERVEMAGGSFFHSVPVADLYVLKQILHDWSDRECEAILGNIRAAIVPGGRLAVIDHIVSDPPQPDEGASTDISMMIWDSGRERRLADFESLFEATGFRMERVSRNPAGHSVIEAVPV